MTISAAAFEVIPMGVGNFFSTRRFCTSFILRAGPRMIMIDCPDPLFRILDRTSRRSGIKIDLTMIDDVILTHLHGDHCNGLEGLGFWRRFHSGIKTRPRIHTSPVVAGRLWDKLSPAMGDAVVPELGMDEHHGLEDYFEVVEHEFGSKFKIGGVAIETRRTIHSVPTFGFRAKFGGRLLGYSCDTTFDPAHIAFLEPCDLIFHECDRGMHTDIAKLEELPAALRAKMRLVHLNDQFKGSRLIRSAREGHIYQV